MLCLRVAFIALFLVISLGTSIAQTNYRSNAVTMNWSEAGNWEIWDGDSWEIATTYPGEVATTGDVTIQDGQTVIVDVSPAQSITRLFVGEGTSGILQYEAATARTLMVSEMVRINQGGTFRSALSGTVTTHQLEVGGSIVNNGTLDFSTAANAAGAGITFTGTSNELFDLSGATLTNLRQSNGLLLNKGTSASSFLSFTPGGTFQVQSASALGFLTIQNGTFRLMGENTFSNPLFYATTGSYTIPSGGGFQLDNPNAIVTAMNGTLTNNGEVIVRRGVYNLGNSSGNELLTTSTGRFEMSGGEVNISGRFRVDGGNCDISGGTMHLAWFGHANQTLAAFYSSGTAGLTISGNPLITFGFPNTNTDTHYHDIELVSGTGIKTITGGTFQMGTGSPLTDRTFLVNSDIPLHNLVINSAHIRVSLSKDLSINNQLTLNGQLLMNTYNLDLGAPAIAGDLRASHGMIISGGGQIHKIVNASGSYVFPFANSSGAYLPVTLNFTGGTFTSGATVSVGMTASKHLQNVNTTNYLRRFWTVQTDGITNPVYNFTGTYTSGDIQGSDSWMTAGIYTTSWQKVRPSINGYFTINANALTGNAAITGINSVATGVTITPSSATVCSGSSVQLTTNATGDAPYTYSWTPSEGLSASNIANPIATPTNTTTYTVTVTDAMGGVATTSATVTVNPALPVSVAIAASANPVCAGSSVTFTATPTNGGTNPVYQWRVNGNNMGANSATYTYVPSNNDIVSCVLTSNATCTTGSPATSNQVTMTVNPILPVSVSIAASDNSVCAGSEVTFTATSTNGGTNPAYQWRVNGNTVGTNSATYSYLPANGDIVTCVLTSDAACATGSPAASNAVTMTVTPLPTASISGTTSVCQNAASPTITFTGAAGTAPYTFTYRVNSGANQTVVSTGNTATVAAPTGSAGEFVYTLVSVQDANCSQLQSGTATITVHPLPNATASSNSPQCYGSTLTLIASGGTSYSWTGPNNYTSTLQNPTISNVTAAVAGLYTVTVTDANGCVATASTSVIINSPPSVSITANPGNSICSGANVIFTTSVTNAGTNPSFQWRINGVPVSGANGATFSTTTLANSQQVTVIVTADPAYCSSTATSNIITMTVNSPVIPTVTIRESQNNICAGTTVNFSSVVVNGGTAPTYQWQINGSNVNGANSASFSSNNLSNGDQVRVVITSNAPCASPSAATSTAVTMVVSPVVTPSVTVAANPSTAICPGTPVTFTASPTNGGSNPVYQWSINGTTVGTNSPTYTSSTLADGDIVRVRMTSNASCVAPAVANSADFVTDVNPGTPAIPAVIAGNTVVCPNGSQTYSIASVTNATSYTWAVPTGWNIQTGQGTNTITVTAGNTGQNGSISVTASNTCGTSGARTLAVSVGSQSTAPTAITVTNNNTCFGTSKTLSVTGGSLGTGATWEWFTGSCGGTPVGTGATLTVNPAGTTIYYVRASGTCNTTACAEGTVIVSPGTPTQPLAITGGASPVCPASSLTYSIPTVNNATSYTWTVPTGWTIASGQGTTTITVTAGNAGQNGNITVTAGNSCGNSTASTLAVTVAPGAPATPESITGAAGQCIGSTGQVYSIVAVPNATTYNWSVPSGWSITSGAGTNSIIVSIPTGAVSGNITVSAGNSCGTSAAVVLAVTINQAIPATPSIPAGDQSVCTTANLLNYSVPSVANATSYLWTLPPGWTIVSGTGTNNISVRFGNNNPGNYTVSVRASNACGTSLSSPNLAISVGDYATANAGTDQIICYNILSINVNGLAGGAANSAKGSWTTSGTGTFANSDRPNTTYSPSAADRTAGTVTLTFTTDVPKGSCGNAATDLMILTIMPNPTASISNNQSICIGSATNITFTATPNTTVTYRINTGANQTIAIGASGTATLNTGALTANTTYSLVSVAYTATPACSQTVTGSAIITVNPVATVSAGADQTICAGSTAILAGSFGGSASSGIWTTSGTGSFSSNTPTAVYTPSAADINAGTVTITYTSNDPDGPCAAANDVMVLTINPVATVNAGGDQTICAGSTVTMNGNFGGSATSGTWTSSGTGTFSNNTPAAVYTPSAADINVGIVTLTYTTNDPVGPCAAVNDAMVLTINPLAIVNAGSDQSICASSPLTLTGIVSGPVTSGTWSGGSGSFSNPASLSTTYTPSAEEISDGTVTLTLTSADPDGPCGTVSDQITVTITPSAIVNAGLDQDICEGSDIILSATIGGAATSATWSTSGTGTFSPNNTTLNATYLPGNAETGDVTLTLTTNDPVGSCNAVSDQMIIHIYPRATVNAGNDQVLCSNGSATMAGTFGGSATSGTWTTNGGGTFNNPSSANAIYTPGNSDIFNGTVTLTFTTNDPDGPCGAVSDFITLTISDEIQITAQPLNTGVCATYPADFSVEAIGDNLTFQWFRGIAPGGTAVVNSTNITGAQSAALHFSHATSADEGSYYVVISGAADCSPVTSSEVTLNVDQEITITSQFQSNTVCENDDITFNIVAEPGGLLNFQWRKNGVNIDGATGHTLNLDNVTLGDAGSYDVLITGMAGYTCSSAVSAPATLTVTPSVETPVFALAATSIRCQGAGNVTYSATANHTTGITYSLDATTAAFTGNSINASTGEVSYAAGWSGTTTITASAAGCNGPATATHTVTVTPTVTIVPFAALTSNRCQGAGTVTYSTTATNSTGITYSIDNASVAGGNTVDASTGAVTFAANWSGSTTITASAAGCNGPATATHTVTVTPTVSIAPFAALTSNRCQSAGTVTYSTTAANSTGITYSLDAASIDGGNTIDASTGALTYAADWVGTTTITASAAGCNGPATATHTVTVGPTVTIAPFASPTSTRCQRAETITYSTTATNSTGITYSFDATTAAFAGNSINASTGAVTFAAGWSGTTTITASAAGCNGPVTATHTVTVTPSVTIAPFSPLTSTRCQGAGTVTYTTTANNNSSAIVYTLDNASLAGGNTINASTGEVTYAAGWSGTTTITASAAGCNGPVTATHTVTVTPTVTIVPFAASTSSRCQGAGTATYTTTATNSTGITYNLDAASLAGGNTINASTGAVTFAAGWSGPITITASAAGCNGPATATHTVITDPISVGGALSPYNNTVCTTTNSGSLTLSGYTGTILRWESSTNAGVSWTQISNTTSTYNFSNLPLTTIFRAVVKSGACPEAYSAPARVVVIPFFEPVITATTVDVCLGNSTTLSVNTSLLQPVGAFTGGGFNQANPEGWTVSQNGGVVSPFPAAGDNRAVGPWAETNGPRTFNGVSYDTQDNTKFAIVNGAINSTLETPVFNLFGLPSAELTFRETHNLAPGATARVELSTDGGNSYNIVLATYTGSTGGIIDNPVNIDMSPYLGMMNMRIRFNYSSPGAGGWALDGISIPSQQTDVTYIWSPAETLSSTTDSVVIATPGVTTEYTLTMMVSGCPVIAKSIVIGVANPPVVQTTNACIGAGPVTFTQTNGTLGGIWRVSGGGTIDATTGVFTPATPGCFDASYITPSGICGDTVSFVVFPAAPLPIVNPLCNEAIVVTPPTAIPGFTLQYSYDDGATWDATAPPTAENCGGYQIRTRYITTLTCAAVGENPASTIPGCDVSPAVTRVVDLTPPAITCPENITASTNPDACYATLVLVPPVVTDNCTAAEGITVASNAPAQYPVGVTTVTWTATDACGNQSTCTQTITITDNSQAPVFTSCPGDQEQTALANNCILYDIVLTEPVAADNCAVTRLTYTTTGATTLTSSETGMNYVSGQDLNVGVTTITYIAYDAAGNASEPCSFTVTILDVTPPNLTISGCVDVSESAAANNCSKIPVTIIDPIYSDDCWPLSQLTLSWIMTGATTGSGTGSVVGQTFNVGVTTVTYEVEDPDGNTATCSFTVTILDVTPPNLTISGCEDVSESAAADNCSTIPVTILDPTYSDDCWPLSQLTLSWIMSGATTGSGTGSVVGQTFNVGVTTVTYEVEDPDGNTATCSFNVTILRLNIPEAAITCPASPAPVSALAGTCFAPVTVDPPVEVDPCETITYTFINDFNGTDNASGSYPVGTTTVIWTITDNSGRITICQQTVVVNDLPPTIICPDPVVVQADFELPYQDAVTVPEPTYGDNCPNPVLTWTMVPPADNASQYTPGQLSGTGVFLSPALFYLGESTITYTVTDANGSTATCSFTVTVLDEPEITCSPEVTYTTDTDLCTATRSSDDYGLPTLVKGLQPITWTWTITNPDGTTHSATEPFIGSSATPGPPVLPDYAFQQGTSTILWRAENTSGYDECTQTVIVTDTQAPTFTLPDPLTECVESLISAVYDPTTIDISPERPDYYILESGSEVLNITGLTDNCCAVGSMTIHWRIDLDGGGSILGTGQPSAYGSDIRLPGDVAPYDDILEHFITFWVEDCNRNTSPEQIQIITIQPRPNLTKGN